LDVEQRGSILKTSPPTLLFGNLESTLPCTKLALVGFVSATLLHDSLDRSVVVEREIQIDI
jgi:hypothetical protein